MRVHAAAIAAAGIVFGLTVPGPATAQIAPHTSDKASAAYSPSALVQTGSRRQGLCFWCAEPAFVAPTRSAALPDDAVDERPRRRRSVFR